MDIPKLGFGTWRLLGDDCYKAVSVALETGYRHIDTADAYHNHKEVGQAIKDSGIKREEYFLTSKTFYDKLKREDVLANGDRFLEELQTDYLDLLLIHWPNKNVPIAETLEAMQELKEKGKIKNIGVSNFTIHHLEDALKVGVEIINNQVELHPTFNQKELVDFCNSKSISVTAYSPLGNGRDMDNSTVVELAEKYNVTPAQVNLNWTMARGLIAIPRSKTPARIKENFNSLNWEMEEADVELMNNIPQQERLIAAEFNEFDY